MTSCGDLRSTCHGEAISGSSIAPTTRMSWWYESILTASLPERDGTGEQPKPSFWRHRHDDINAYERHLDRNGTHVVKVFLHLSQEEQRRRLLDRLDDQT